MKLNTFLVHQFSIKDAGHMTFSKLVHIFFLSVIRMLPCLQMEILSLQNPFTMQAEDSLTLVLAVVLCNLCIFWLCGFAIYLARSW